MQQCVVVSYVLKQWGNVTIIYIIQFKTHYGRGWRSLLCGNIWNTFLSNLLVLKL
jgi:hypothetical protein